MPQGVPHLPLISYLTIAPQEFCNWPDEAFEEMDTLAVQQYIQQLIKHDPSEIDTILRMPDGQDEGVWKYEHLRWVLLLLTTKRVQLHISRDVFFVVQVQL